jgi:copper chaperone CopZ
MLVQLSLARCALALQQAQCRTRQSVVCASSPTTPHAHGAPVRLRARAARLAGRVALQRRGSSLRAAASDTDEEGFEVDLQVVGMRCEGCVENVTKALKATANVKQVSVDLATGVATCEVTAETMVRPRAPACAASLTHAQFDAVVLTPALIAAVKGAGFVATAIL